MKLHLSLKMFLVFNRFSFFKVSKLIAWHLIFGVNVTEKSGQFRQSTQFLSQTFLVGVFYMPDHYFFLLRLSWGAFQTNSKYSSVAPVWLPVHNDELLPRRQSFSRTKRALLRSRWHWKNHQRMPLNLLFGCLTLEGVWASWIHLSTAHFAHLLYWSVCSF